ncbi:AAA family ATPase, partial [Pseudomonas viridiflava]|uniref:AAA family ATPase n=1 Tax=Pseudomonas viridiflava TaxID=33069 RepID=UPI001F120808
YIHALNHCEASIMAARIWTIQNLKGGTTKTTTATNVACCLADKHKKSVLLVDLDGRQGSATDWLRPAQTPRR